MSPPWASGQKKKPMQSRKFASARPAQRRAGVDIGRECIAWIACADGVPSAGKVECAAFHAAALECLPFTRNELSRVAERFRIEKLRYYSVSAARSAIARRRFLRILISIAAFDGPMSDQTAALIDEVAEMMKVRVPKSAGRGAGGSSTDRSRYSRSMAGAAGPLAAYHILGCRPDDSDDAVRKKYRMLAARLHPDKHAATVESPEAMSRCVARFQELQSAYDTIRKSRRGGDS